MDRDYYQFAYVTNDFGQAIDALRKQHGMGPFHERRDLELPIGPDRVAVGHFGVAFKGSLQFEVIQPLAQDVALYVGLVPQHGFGMAFHHLGRCFSSLDAYQTALVSARKQWEIPIDYGAFGGFFAYADARPIFGHFLLTTHVRFQNFTLFKLGGVAVPMHRRLPRGKQDLGLTWSPRRIGRHTSLACFVDAWSSARLAVFCRRNGCTNERRAHEQYIRKLSTFADTAGR